MAERREGSSRLSLVGARIGRYEIIAEIGTGGMASVYLARSTGSAGFRRLVAIKVMHPHLSADDQFVDMFLDEARVASSVHHPNVVPIIDVGVEEDLIYLTMDYVEGDSLSNVEKVAVNLRRRIPLGITLRVTLDALAGLHAAHELCAPDGSHLKIIHRDVSPQNIVIGVDGSSRIVDFGIAKAESRVTHTQVGMIKGKLNFMAPEQLRSQPLDRRVDIFGMGVTLWEAITLRRLFAGGNDFDTARRILQGEYPSLLEFDPKLPAALDEIVRTSLRPDQDERYATAEDFAEALESALKPMIASHREVATFISGVASQKLERERRAVRETAQAPVEVQDPMASTMVESRAALSASPTASGPILPNAGAPRDRSAEYSGTRPASRVRAPTMAMPSQRAPKVAPPAPAPPTPPRAPTPRPAARPAGRASPPSAAPRQAPSDPPPSGDPTMAMDVPMAGVDNMPYDDDGETEMISRRQGAIAPMLRGRAPADDEASDSTLDEPEFQGARTVFQHDWQPTGRPGPPSVPPGTPAGTRASSPGLSAAAAEELFPVSGVESTQAIDLLPRRQSSAPPPPTSASLNTQPPQGPVQGPMQGPAPFPGNPFPQQDYVMGGPVSAPPVGAVKPAGGISPWVYVFLSVALLSVASALLWFVVVARRG